MFLIDLQLEDQEGHRRQQEQDDMEDSLEGEYHIHDVAHELLYNTARTFRNGIQIIEYTKLEEHKELYYEQDHRKEDQHCLHDHVHFSILGNGRKYRSDHSIRNGEEQNVDGMPSKKFLFCPETEYQLIIKDRERNHRSGNKEEERFVILE